jgi:hypothetical protein
MYCGATAGPERLFIYLTITGSTEIDCNGHLPSNRKGLFIEEFGLGRIFGKLLVVYVRTCNLDSIGVYFSSASVTDYTVGTFHQRLSIQHWQCCYLPQTIFQPSF